MKPLWSCALAAMMLPASGAATERVWNFRVLLDGTEVGAHSFRVSEQEGERQVVSDARFTVKFLFLDAYRYLHLASERWQGDCLTQIRARTDDNGKQLAVQGTRRGNVFAVSGPEGMAQLPTCVMSFAYWNPRMLQQTRLLNAQTGELQPVRVEPLGEETLSVRGAPQRARRYALRGEQLHIDLWYADNDDWVRLESQVAGGRTLHYQIQ